MYMQLAPSGIFLSFSGDYLNYDDDELTVEEFEHSELTQNSSKFKYDPEKMTLTQKASRCPIVLEVDDEGEVVGENLGDRNSGNFDRFELRYDPKSTERYNR